MRAVVITGATGGIGRALTQVCVEKDAFDRYVFYGRNSAALTSAAEPFGERAEAVRYDMETEYAAPRLVPEAFLEGVLEITVVLLAFVIEPITAIEDAGIAAMEQNIRINILSQINLLQQYVRYAKEHEARLRVVFADSGAAYGPLKGWSPYCCAKAYMDMYCRCLADEKGCEVVLYDPGVVDTGMQEVIRGSSPLVFDRVEEFVGYRKKGLLNAPRKVAEDMHERYLERWSADKLCERYRA